MKKSYHTKKTKYWAKHLRKYGKRVVNKQTRKEVKEFFESFVGLLKGDGDVLGELMKEKKIEREA
jgi:hypothetical protein